MRPRKKPETVLLVLLAAAIVSTAIHYSDNTISIHQYPPPEPSQALIVLAWLALTPFAVAGYALFRSGRALAASLCLAVYAPLALSTPGHFVSRGPARFPFWRDVSILSDGVLGTAVLAFAIWAARRAIAERPALREARQRPARTV